MRFSLSPFRTLLAVGCIAFAGAPAFASDTYNPFRIKDGEVLDLGSLAAPGLVRIYNGGNSGMKVQIWNSRTGMYEQFDVAPGTVWSGNYGQFSTVQIYEVPDHKDGKGGFSLPKP